MSRPETARRCFCEQCRFSRQVSLVRNYGNATAKQMLIDELCNRLACVEMDNDVWEAIKDGSWPSARQMAEHIIRRCDAREETDNAQS